MNRPRLPTLLRDRKPDMNEMHEANRRYWDANAEAWRQLRDRDDLWRRCPAQPELAFGGAALEMIRDFVGELRGKDVCVIGSGDNYAAFALAGLGAKVTSTDISAEQLAVAARRAEQLGLEIRFLRADAADLTAFDREAFDLVFSSNGFFVWIAEPRRVMSSVHRVLRVGGYYIFYDVHPFLRPWKDQIRPIQMEKPYFEIGPFTSDQGGRRVYEFHWTLQDILNALAEADLSLCQMAESPAADARFWQDYSYLPGTDQRLLNWRRNPRAGLPVWLTVAAEKR
jgi:SAM-dependent methyltransferase